MNSSAFSMTKSKSVPSILSGDSTLNPETIRTLLEISQTDPSTLLNDAVRESNYNPDSETTANLLANSNLVTSLSDAVTAINEISSTSPDYYDPLDDNFELGYTLGSTAVSSIPPSSTLSCHPTSLRDPSNRSRAPSFSWAVNHPHPLEATVRFTESQQGGGRPMTGSEGYLETCDRNNVNPWSLLTKCSEGKVSAVAGAVS